MILDILTVLFFISGLLLIFYMIRQRRRDVLHGKYVSKSEMVRTEKKPIDAKARREMTKPPDIKPKGRD